MAIETQETATAEELVWDGVTHAYIPSEPLQVPASVKLHTASAPDVDPITYEVIRHSLWNINLEHGKVIQNLAVSPISLETRDFQTSLMTEDGDTLFFGPYLQYFSGIMDIMVKYLIEKRGEEPGIRDGDVFLHNDPWVGTAHQPDVIVCEPFFWEDEIFCWVGNCMHQNDVGGTVPGSFCPNAQDIFWDPPVLPPMRIVRDGKIDTELEAIYRRQSRTPINLALDLRAAIAGCHAAKARLGLLLQKYGPETVKGVMRKTLQTAEKAFVGRMERIPDGTWRERLYQEVAVTGDRGVYRWDLTVTKKGANLIFENAGTEPQAGATNLPFAAWRGTILATLNVIMLGDQMGAGGGAITRHIEFRPTPGTQTCPDWGAAVSPAGIYCTEAGIAMANSLVSKMLLCSSDPELRGYALSTTPGQWHLHIHAGYNQRGDYYVGPMLDAMIGTTGATPYQDGVFANGVWWIPEGQGPNVETYERDWPILYLYRKEDKGSAGAGKFRGGNGGVLAYMPYKGQVGVGVYTAEGVPKTPGVLGGYPGARGETVVVQNSDVREKFRAGELPGSVEELQGERHLAIGKGPALALGDADVLEWNWGSCAGYGDPIERDPESVLRDMREKILSAEQAQAQYGVVFTSDLEVDAEATAQRRLSVRRERLRSANAPEPDGLEQRLRDRRSSPVGAIDIGDAFWVASGTGETHCAQCGTELAASGESVKSKLALHEGPITGAGPKFVDPSRFVDATMVFREFFCPQCGALLASEVAREGDDVLNEVQLEVR
jgi:N-methylhydantoinase B